MPKYSKPRKGHRVKKFLKDQRKQRAIEHIEQLTNLAEQEDFYPYRDRYAKLILKMGQKVQQPIPRETKIRLCRACGSWFTSTPQSTYRVRLRSKPIPHVVYTCLKCGNIRRISYK